MQSRDASDLKSKDTFQVQNYESDDWAPSDYDDELSIGEIPQYSPDDFDNNIPEELIDTSDDTFDDDPLSRISKKGRPDAPDITEFIATTKKQIESDMDSFNMKCSENEHKWEMDDELCVIRDAVFVLVGAACGNASLYDQLKTHTRDCLEEYGFVQNVDSVIKEFRTEYISQSPVDEMICDYITYVSRDASVKEKVSVLPLMCGTGKSMAITKLIINTVKQVERAKKEKRKKQKRTRNEELQIRDRHDGLLVVTDNKERLKSLWSKNERRSTKDNEFIESHADGWVTVMTEENSQEADTEQQRTPVLLITTQRYFNWTKEEIQEHLVWGEEFRRPLVIFDEMPYLNELCDISVKTLNDIDTALWLGLDNFTKLKEKMWCIRQWEKFRDRFTRELFSFEREYDMGMFYYESERKTITDDDKKFFTIIDDNKGTFRKNQYFREYCDMHSIKTLLSSWGIFSHRNADTGAYENKVTVFIDNRDKLTNLGAKVIVLDGTGDVSPIYDGQDYIHIHKGTKFLRSLSYLAIKLCDYGTSRNDFFNDRNRIAPHIKKYLKEDGNKMDEIYYFTYKSKRGKFSDSKHTAHFGDIKGKNEFNTATVIAQVGLNSLQPSQYLTHVLARNEELRLTLIGKEHAETEKMLKQIANTKIYRSFSAKHILADVDQCLFRSAIRNSDNTKNTTYYLFYKNSTNRLLTDQIKKRYAEMLKASVLPVSNELIEAAWTKESDAAYAKIFNWLNGKWDGAPVKKKAVMEELGMLESTFDSTVRRHFREQFDQLKINAKELGCPGGYYANVVQNEQLYNCARFLKCHKKCITKNFSKEDT